MRCVVALLLASLTALPARAEIRDDIDRLAGKMVEDGKAVGVVVAVIVRGKEPVFAAYGRTRADGPAPDADTVFEIGSVTKAFTGVLLADLAAAGSVKLDDPVARHLPEGWKVPEGEGGRAITLADLSSHASGLPRLLANLPLTNLTDPYARYGAAELRAFLAGHTLRRKPGEQYEYSNLGAGLLGSALAHRAGTDFDTLVRRRIAGPLKLADTGVALSDGQKSRLAAGHNAAGKPVAGWNFDALAGAGALRSTARDLAGFTAAAMGAAESPLSAAFKAAATPRFDTGKGLRLGLGWHIVRPGGFTRDVVWHNGMTGGYASFAGYLSDGSAGVVVLTNSQVSVDAAAIGLLRKLSE